MAALTELSINELRDGLDRKEFSCNELTKAYLAKIEASKDLNAFVSTFSEEVLSSAGEADQRISAGESKPLLGIPLALKDIITTKIGNTSCGSRILQNYSSPFDATLVQKLSDAGAICLGKTNMDEFAMGASNENSAFGPCKNPWNLRKVPGGSSGGSAAAVSAGLCAGAIGTDTGGSIRQPASFCNLTGLKPTYGRVSRYGLVAFASSLDQAGPLTRTAQDAATLCEAIAGYDPLDSTSVEQEVPSLSDDLSGEIKGLRIGVPKEYFKDGLHPDVLKQVRAAIDLLESQGAQLVEVSLPHTEEAVATYYIISPAEASSNLARYDGIRYGDRAEAAEELRQVYARSRSQSFGPEVKRRILIGTYVLSQGYYDAYYLRAQKVRQLIARDFQEVFEQNCDLIACPTAPSPAFNLGEKVDDPLEMYLNDVYTVPASLAGLPAISVPCGFSEDELPIGLQLIGKPWDEQTLLNVAHRHQLETDWHSKSPPLKEA